jgi:hypothetical protein
LTLATDVLRVTNAFNEPDSDHRLTLPSNLGLQVRSRPIVAE